MFQDHVVFLHQAADGDGHASKTHTMAITRPPTGPYQTHYPKSTDTCHIALLTNAIMVREVRGSHCHCSVKLGLAGHCFCINHICY